MSEDKKEKYGEGTETEMEELNKDPKEDGQGKVGEICISIECWTAQLGCEYVHLKGVNTLNLLHWMVWDIYQWRFSNRGFSC